jgi:hypothetical protein
MSTVVPTNTTFFTAGGASAPSASISSVQSRFGSYNLDEFDFAETSAATAPAPTPAPAPIAVAAASAPSRWAALKDEGAAQAPIQFRSFASMTPADAEVTAVQAPVPTIVRDFGGLASAVEADRQERIDRAFGPADCRAWLSDPEAAAVPAGPSAAELQEKAYCKYMVERQQQEEERKLRLGPNFAKYNLVEDSMASFARAILKAGTSVPKEQFLNLRKWVLTLSVNIRESALFTDLERDIVQLRNDWVAAVADAQQLHDKHLHFLDLGNTVRPQDQDQDFSPLSRRVSMLSTNVIKQVNLILTHEECATLPLEERRQLHATSTDLSSVTKSLWACTALDLWTPEETHAVATSALSVIRLLYDCPLTKNTEMLGLLMRSAYSLLDPYNTRTPLHERLGAFLGTGVKQQEVVLKRFEVLGQHNMLQRIHEVKIAITRAVKTAALAPPVEEEDVDSALAAMANVRDGGKRKQPVNAHKNQQAASGGGGSNFMGGGAGVNPRLDTRDKLRAKRQGAGID